MGTATASLAPAVLTPSTPPGRCIDRVESPPFCFVLRMPVARPTPLALDPDSRAWVADLQAHGARRELAVARLNALLLRVARSEINHRRAGIAYLGESEFDDLAKRSAADALVALLAKLGDYRGESRFTTWAYKFALLEAGVKLRRRAWHGREIPLEDEPWSRLADERARPVRDAETKELPEAVRAAIEEELTAHERHVLLAIAINGVPLDVLADRLGSTRGAVYRTVHDARQKLRARLAGGESHMGHVERGVS